MMMLTDPAHNTMNAAAIAIPVTAFFIKVSPIITVFLGLAGIAWYGVLFYDRFIKKRWPDNHI